MEHATDAGPDLTELLGLLDAVVNVLGPKWTVVLVLGLYGIFTLRRLREAHLADDAAKRQEAEKERALQRAANEAREYRIAMFKDKLGWSTDEISAFVMLEQVDDGASSRRQVGNKAKLKLVEQESETDVEGA